MLFVCPLSFLGLVGMVVIFLTPNQFRRSQYSLVSQLPATALETLIVLRIALSQRSRDPQVCNKWEDKETLFCSSVRLMAQTHTRPRSCSAALPLFLCQVICSWLKVLCMTRGYIYYQGREHSMVCASVLIIVASLQ